MRSTESSKPSQTEPPVALTWQEVTSPGPAIHLRGRGPGEVTLGTRRASSRGVGAQALPSSQRPGAGGDGMFPSPRGRGRRAGLSGEDGMCRGASPGRTGAARRVGEVASRQSGRPGVPPPGVPGRESLAGISGFQNRGGDSLRASGFQNLRGSLGDLEF